MSRRKESRSCLVLRHVAFEGLGVLAELLPAYGFATRICEVGVEPLPEAEIAACDLLIVLGGPIGVYETEAYPFLVAETGRHRGAVGVEKADARHLPRRATHGGGAGRKSRAGTVQGNRLCAGDADRGGPRLAAGCSGGRSRFALAWRRLRASAGRKNLAFTSICPHQAFALDSWALALQFHVEAEPASLEAWLIGHTVELGKAGIDPRDIRAQAARAGRATTAAGSKLFRAWLDGVCA